MAKYANQKSVKINREGKGNEYLLVSRTSYQAAAKNLNNGNAFMLYMYLCDNANGYKKDLSPAAIENAIGLKRATYYRAIERLEEVGYLQETETGIEFFEALSQNETNSQSQNTTKSQNEIQKSQNEIQLSQNEMKLSQNEYSNTINTINTINNNIVKVAKATSTLVVEQEKETVVEMSYIDFVRMMTNPAAREKVSYIEDKIVRVPLGLREITGATAEDIQTAFVV